GEGVSRFSRRLRQGHGGGPVKQLFRGPSYTQGIAWLEEIDAKVIPAKLAGDDNAADAAFTQADAHFDEHRKAIEDLATAVEKDNKTKEDAATRSISHRIVELGLLIVCVCGIVVVLGWVTSRAITSSLRKTVEVVQTAAEGDLRKRVVVDSKDEPGQMGDALNHMLDRISQAIREIGASANQLASASEEFSNTSQQITANSEETSTQARVVSSATEQVNHNLQTVAT